jgi:hypothetical protein
LLKRLCNLKVISQPLVLKKISLHKKQLILKNLQKI